MNEIKFLIDTDWIIDHFNGVKSITSRLMELRPNGLAVSVISVAELWEGIHYSRDARRSEEMLKEFLSGVSVLGLDESICRIFGLVRGELRSRGESRGDFDLLIAATALQKNLTLLTNNRKHFDGIAGLQIRAAR